jgi:hypothetical protein
VSLRQLLMAGVKFAQEHHNEVDSDLIQTRLAQEMDLAQEEVLG